MDSNFSHESLSHMVNLNSVNSFLTQAYYPLKGQINILLVHYYSQLNYA